MPPQEQTKGFFRETFEFILIALVIALPIRFFVAQPFIVSGDSMVPTFQSGDYLIIDQLSYRFTEPARGDVIVFRYPNNPSKFFIKRIVGLPGEEISIHEGQVSIVEPSATTSPTILSEPYINDPTAGDTTYPLTSDQYFVMGDNRGSSADSRMWGPLPRNLITGRALVRLLPPTKIGTNPGSFKFNI